MLILQTSTRRHLVGDSEIENDPDKYFDKIIEIDLSKLEPHIVGPHTPDLARPISKLSQDVKRATTILTTFLSH